jgi:hypothetical protein
MKKLHTFGLATAMLLATVSMAEAQVKRSGGGTGPNGGSWSSSGSGSCTKGAGCSSQGSYSYTSPAGKTKTANRKSNSSCSGGSCTRASTWSR